MRIGSLVICINDAGWMDSKTYESTFGPQLNEICTVSGFPKPGFITLEEYDDLSIDDDTNNWPIDQFREIQPPMNIEIDNLIEETLEV